MGAINWARSMQRTYEFYKVDPVSWADMNLLDFINSCDIDRDADSDDLMTASFSMDAMLDECYIRVYLVAVQGSVVEKHPLGTFLVQSSDSSRYSSRSSFNLDGYSPLHELSENHPMPGYYVKAGENVIDAAYNLLIANGRAPVVRDISNMTLTEAYVADGDETWLEYISTLVAKDNKHLGLDEMGRIIFVPNSTIDESAAVWEFADNEYSILTPDVGLTNDIYGIPNVVEVTYSKSNVIVTAMAENTDRSSPVSIPSRGRRIVYRDTDPTIPGIPTQEDLNSYAKDLLESLSSVQYELSYVHGYCPVRVGDCVRFNYIRNGLTDIKCRITTQSIPCDSGCQVSETAVFTSKLWKRG